jgi:ELWxxDGT repeat protein
MSVNFVRPARRALLLVLFALSLDTAHGQTASLVRDVNSTGPGKGGSPAALYAAPGKLFFLGRGIGAEGVWASDGTSSGTALLTDLCPQSSCGFPPTGFLGDIGGIGAALPQRRTLRRRSHLEGFSGEDRNRQGRCPDQ